MISYSNRNDDLLETCLAYVFESYDFCGNLLEKCDEGELYWVEDKKIFDLNLLDNDLVSLKWIYDQSKVFVGEFVSDGFKPKKSSVLFY